MKRATNGKIDSFFSKVPKTVTERPEPERVEVVSKGLEVLPVCNSLPEKVAICLSADSTHHPNDIRLYVGKKLTDEERFRLLTHGNPRRITHGHLVLECQREQR